MGLGALLLILAILGRKLWVSGHYYGLGEGFRLGYDHGDRDGFNRGYSRALVDRVLVTPTLCEHNDQMLRMVGADARPVQDEDIQRLIDAIPGVAEVLHEHVGEEAGQ